MLPGDVMEPLPESANPVWPFPFVPQDWEHTPAAVQAYVHTLQDELTRLRAGGSAGGALAPEFQDFPSATVLRLAVQEAAPTDHHAPESGWETGPSRPSAGAVTS